MRKENIFIERQSYGMNYLELTTKHHILPAHSVEISIQTYLKPLCS